MREGHRELSRTRRRTRIGDLWPASLSIRTRDAIAAALAEVYGDDTADKLGGHMSDWNGDAAFIVALRLCPERFTPDEIRAGVGMFLGHASNLIAEACRLTGTYVWEDFPYDDNEAAEDA